MIHVFNGKKKRYASFRLMTARLMTARLIATAVVLAASMSGSVWAAKLVGLESSALPGDALEIKFLFDSAPPMPAGYTIESPARIALDLKGVETGLAEKYHSLGNGLTLIHISEPTRPN